MVPKKWFASLTATVVLFSSVTWALGFPVYDAVNHQNNTWQNIQNRIQRAQQFAEEILQMKAQISALRDQLNWHKLMAGGWRNILERLPGEKADQINRRVIELEQLGWRVDDLDRFRRLGSAREAVAALGDLRRVLEGQASPATVRTATEQIWGNVPVTEEGVKVEAAYQTIATVTAEHGRIEEALRETYENISRLEEQLDAGEVVPEDRERIRARLDVQRARLQTLQIDATNSTNQLLLQVAGMGASNIVRQQESQIRGQQELSNWFGGVKQGPRQRREKRSDL